MGLARPERFELPTPCFVGNAARKTNDLHSLIHSVMGAMNALPDKAFQRYSNTR